ncbi:MAG TPA: peptidoglycan DD-metalloendopeptidase family protein [Steroidobacteraceae bacterium]|jgi:septal ring factor EnvC (AmiA/AmiB activator)|nr:peptidoglycan DD-metalloendopeptidase family protein [Steroidobacteraceae bacterium]
MNRAVKHLRILAALTLVMCAGAAGLAADSPDSAEAKAKLAAVRARIAALTNRLGIELKQRDALNARLREADLEVTAKRQRLDALHAAELAAERRRSELRADQTRNQTALAAERAALAGQVRAAYMIGQQEQLTLMLNQTNPAEMGRLLAYYGYFARERGAKIGEISDHVVRLQELVAEIEQTTANLRSLEDDVGQEMTGLERARTERAAALAALLKQVSSGNLELSQLKREEQAVESLVADLAQVLQDFPVDAQQSFDQLRGKLPWPVAGRLTARYQELRANAAESSMRWNGVMIETARGAKVRAPYFGRVIYADWLQGLGLLLIIGHNGNYMTLYGHAEVLYKSVGDWVAPGDVIAALSDAGEVPPQLYFEIRDGRKTVDPKIWLRTKP